MPVSRRRTGVCSGWKLPSWGHVDNGAQGTTLVRAAWPWEKPVPARGPLCKKGEAGHVESGQSEGLSGGGRGDSRTWALGKGGSSVSGVGPCDFSSVPQTQAKHPEYKPMHVLQSLRSADPPAAVLSQESQGPKERALCPQVLTGLSRELCLGSHLSGPPLSACKAAPGLVRQAPHPSCLGLPPVTHQSAPPPHCLPSGEQGKSSSVPKAQGHTSRRPAGNRPDLGGQAQDKDIRRPAGCK